MDNRCDNLKYNAYREIVDSIDVARSIIYNMKLAYGESAIVPFWYPAKSDPSATSRDVYTLMGTGSMNGSVLFTSNLLTSDTILDQATIRDFEFNGETYGEISLKDAMKIVDKAIEDISGGKTLVSVLESLVNEVSELKETLAADSSIYEGIGQSLSEIKETLSTDSSTFGGICKILDDRLPVAEIEEEPSE